MRPNSGRLFAAMLLFLTVTSVSLPLSATAQSDNWDDWYYSYGIMPQLGPFTWSDGSPIVNATLELYENMNSTVFSAKTDLEGIARFSQDMPYEYYSWSLLRDGRVIMDGEIAITEDTPSGEVWWPPDQDPPIASLTEAEFDWGGDDDDDSCIDDDDDDDECDSGSDDDSSGSLFALCGAVIVIVVVILVIVLNYSKIKREKLLDHSTRQSIYDHIRENPGAHLRAIKSDLELPMGVLNHHLYKLESEEIIKSRTDGQYKCFYPAGFKVERSLPHLSDKQKEIYNSILGKQGITPAEISDKTAQPLKNVYYHVDALERQGLITTVKDGKIKHCYVASAA